MTHSSTSLFIQYTFINDFYVPDAAGNNTVLTSEPLFWLNANDIL